LISKSTIDQVFQSAQIYDVVADFVKLKKQGSLYQGLCPFHDEKTPSFTVTPSKNIYKCFGGCGKGGDPIKFVMEHENLNYPDAIRYLAGKYNILVEEEGKSGTVTPNVSSTVKSTPQNPPPPENTPKSYKKHPYKGIPLTERAINWHVQERKISQSTLEHYKVSSGNHYMPIAKKEIEVIQYNYYLNDEYINTKFRGPSVNGKKDLTFQPQSELTFYGIDHVKHSEEIMITEGELEPLSWYEAGYKWAVSVPNGSNSKFDFLDKIYDSHLKNKKKVYIAVDNDEPGHKLRDEILRLFGRDVCYVIDFPKLLMGDRQDKDGNTVPIYTKDGNDILVLQGKEALMDLYQNAKGYDIPGVYGVEDVEDEMWEMFRNKEFHPMGTPCYIDIFKKNWSWRKGEINVGIGPANQGKSTLFSNTLPLLKSIQEGDKWAVWGPEAWPATNYFDDIIHTYIGQSTNPNFPTLQMSEEKFKQGLKFCKQHFYYVYPDDEHDYNTIFEKFKSMIIKHNITGIILDPVNQLDRTGDDAKIRDDQFLSRFYSKLKRFIISHGLYCMVITHCDQRLGENNLVLKPNWQKDIEGGKMTGKKVDNILFYYRPHFEQDINNSLCVFGSSKIKIKKLTGEPGEEEFTFDGKTNRYYDRTGHDIMIYKGEDEEEESNQQELFEENRESQLDIPDAIYQRKQSFNALPPPKEDSEDRDIPF
jgi:hypothetical protein